MVNGYRQDGEIASPEQRDKATIDLEIDLIEMPDGVGL
jgi:hypothetical protein